HCTRSRWSRPPVLPKRPRCTASTAIGPRLGSRNPPGGIAAVYLTDRRRPLRLCERDAHAKQLRSVVVVGATAILAKVPPAPDRGRGRGGGPARARRRPAAPGSDRDERRVAWSKLPYLAFASTHVLQRWSPGCPFPLTQ